MILCLLTLSTSCVSWKGGRDYVRFPASMSDVDGLHLDWDVDGSRTDLTRVQALELLRFIKDLRK